MIAKCPKDATHDVFITTAHVVEEWKVDKYGHWLEVIGCIEIAQKPSLHNYWTCAICGSEAIVTNKRR